MSIAKWGVGEVRERYSVRLPVEGARQAEDDVRPEIEVGHRHQKPTYARTEVSEGFEVRKTY